MLPEQQLFAGGAMNPTAGMAMNPLLQGFGSYQNMQDQFQNTALNQQSQDIANQAAQHALEQSRLGDPLAAAKRDVELGQAGIDQSQINSGEALKTRQMQDQAKQSKAFQEMDDADIAKHENARKAVIEVAQHMEDPDYLMKPEQAQADLKYLKDHGFHSLPDVVDHEFMSNIKMKAAEAPDTLLAIQDAKKAKAAADAAQLRTETTAKAMVEASQNRIQTQRDLATAALDPDKKILLAADTEYAQSDGKMTAETAIQAKNVIRTQILAGEEAKNLDNEVARYANGLNLKPKELDAKAKAANLSPDLTDEQKIVELSKIERKKELDDLVNSKFKDRWPNVTIINKTGALNPRTVAAGNEPATNVNPATKGLGTNKVSGQIRQGDGTTPAAPTAKPASAYQVGARVKDEAGHPGTIDDKGQFVPD
jgi:hypothetical protein